MKNNVHMKMGEIFIANSACTLEPFYGFLFAIWYDGHYSRCNFILLEDVVIKYQPIQCNIELIRPDHSKWQSTLYGKLNVLIS